MTHRPQLLIDATPLEDQELKEKIFEETAKYSITPRTFDSRDYQRKIVVTELQNRIESLKLKVKDTQEKLKEKIDKISQNLQQDVDAKLITLEQKHTLLGKNDLYSFYKTREEELKQYQEKIGLINQFNYQDLSIFVDTYKNNSGNVVCRYGLNSSVLVDTVTSYNTALQQKGPPLNQKSGGSSKTELPKTVLHPLEIITIIKAINDVQKKAKTALIDIFVRDDIVKGDKEKIKFDVKTRLPETHTVVLYQKSSGDIILIDPSNSDFSKHLASEMSNLLVSGKLMDQTLKIPTKEIKIYTPAKDTGPGSKQYRDCIDIATKIAFGLNSLDLKEIISIENVLNKPFIEQINNNTFKPILGTVESILPQTVKDLFKPESGNVWRIRQASDDNIRIEVDNVLKNIIQFIAFVECQKSDSKQAILNNIQQILQSQIINPDMEYSKTIELLKDGLKNGCTELSPLLGSVPVSNTEEESCSG